MNLHENPEVFEELILATASELRIPTSVVEKDYFVTIVLKLLTSRMENIVFKGGTSLTKGYQLLERFSEDIDLTFDANIGKPSESTKKKLKQIIIGTFEELNFPVSNISEIKSRRNYNCYRAEYPTIYPKLDYIKSEVIVETYIALLSFPTTTRKIDNYIYRFLKSIDRMDLIIKYDLEPFEVKTQMVERTLVDKLFAICDYYLESQISGHSRHIYDIHMIIDNYGIPENFLSLISEVRLARKHLPNCPSAKSGVDILQLLNDIIHKDVYKSDYELITTNLLFKNVPYELAIGSLKQVIASGVWK
ncbi:nucleotidyl transferase AbiEii/AbiGii toxin family protein [Enterococcus cecorum]|uniref:nucleotidyl transferase AbiEii/AbiGii toxin family protein n=1 Tax=Enterococcus cecorum TaxID=44008 RepID=UPI00200AC2B6|nr:nucleotidyl transferase AbiEii/AbiGii toxin family protein [Enterococcus cecorum]